MCAEKRELISSNWVSDIRLQRLDRINQQALACCAESFQAGTQSGNQPMLAGVVSFFEVVGAGTERPQTGPGIFRRLPHG